MFLFNLIHKFISTPPQSSNVLILAVPFKVIDFIFLVLLLLLFPKCLLALRFILFGLFPLICFGPRLDLDTFFLPKIF